MLVITRLQALVCDYANLQHAVSRCCSSMLKEPCPLPRHEKTSHFGSAVKTLKDRVEPRSLFTVDRVEQRSPSPSGKEKKGISESLAAPR